MPRSRADEGVGRPAAWSGVGSTMLAAGVQHRVRQPTRHNNAPHWTRDGANLAASGQSGEAVSRGGYDQHARLGAASNLVARRAAPGSSLPVQTRGRRSMTVDEAQRARTRGEERAVVRARCGVEVPPTRAATTKERKKGGRGSGSLACVPACLRACQTNFNVGSTTLVRQPNSAPSSPAMPSNSAHLRHPRAAITNATR